MEGRFRSFLNSVNEFVFRECCFVTVTLPCLLANLIWPEEICTRMVKTAVTRKKNNSQQVSNILSLVIPYDPVSVIVPNAIIRKNWLRDI